jgi:hypothetical protein
MPSVVVKLVPHLLGVVSLCVDEPPILDVGTVLGQPEVCFVFRPLDDEAIQERWLIYVGDAMDIAGILVD